MRNSSMKKITRVAILLMAMWTTSLTFFVLMDTTGYLTSMRDGGKRRNITTAAVLVKDDDGSIKGTVNLKRKSFEAKTETNISSTLSKRSVQSAINNNMKVNVVHMEIRKSNGSIYRRPERTNQQSSVCNGNQDPCKIILMRNEAAERRYYTMRKTKVNPIEHEYLITSGQLCDSGPPYVLMVVPSVPKHFQPRQVIRTTMGRFAKPTNKLKLANISFKLVFVVGRDGDTQTDKLIKNESRTYGDVVQADFIDSYYNLTRKMLVTLKWVSIFCAEIEYMLKADEDVFVNIPLLMKYLKSFPQNIKGSIHGHVYISPSVERLGKWAVKLNEFPLSQYPRYASGNSYVISGNLIPRMFMVSEYLPYMPIEDAFLTGILSKMVETNLINHAGFTHFSDKQPLIPCEFASSNRISVTKVTSSLMSRLWKACNWFEFYCGNNSTSKF
ncbi:beta-1,3-galactosyltransferase 1-like [Mya arenaria]|uniref:beta-1,3-galactosyltransferase 1-like n=1 Tax=Mya arenaria TaxID=6604 RepID=UPI0022E2F793|nr:beta-1,3-galactosyltransferase 1-like [Mya arenaria]